MIIAKKVAAVREWRNGLGDVSVGFVPTMGALHRGHLSLVEKSQSVCGKTCVSIFVNPTQFNDPKDFAQYPIDLETDFQMLRDQGVDLAFVPDYQEIYQDNYRYKVQESEISKILCGEFRAGHFDGVLTVVMKLLNVVNADQCFMGEKDYQQFMLVKEMATTFFMPTKIVPCLTLREADGLAMSSRNRLLSANERELAPLLFAKLKSKHDLAVIRDELNAAGFQVEYLQEYFGRRFIAANLGQVRLIDNVAL